MQLPRLTNGVQCAALLRFPASTQSDSRYELSLRKLIRTTKKRDSSACCLMKSAVEMVGNIPQLGKAVLSTSSWVFPYLKQQACPTNFLRRRVCHRLPQNFRIFWRSCRRNKSRKLGRSWSFGLGIVLASLASSRERQSSQDTTQEYPDRWTL